MDSFSRGSRCAARGWPNEDAMNPTLRALIRLTAIWFVVAACATSAAAQTSVRVVVDRSTILAHDFRSPVAVVRAGSILTVVSQRKDWYEVVIPGFDGLQGQTGFIFKSFVGAVTEPVRLPARVSPPSSVAMKHAARSRPLGVVGFGQFGYTRFSAQQSVQAITGNGGGAVLGAGGEVRIGRLFVGASIDRYTKTGQRVLVVDREVFGLGVPDTISLIPMTAIAGWRFEHQSATPYVGGGVGTVLFKEESLAADPAENIRTHFRSYHVAGGVEFRNGWVATAFEMEYSRIPDAIGVAGASAAFHESNLGGVVGRIKILVGR
jgi:opacity protein-like surface antigen